jgi:hypothetical protein
MPAEVRVIATVQDALGSAFEHVAASGRAVGSAALGRAAYVAAFARAADLAAFGHHAASLSGGHQPGLMALAAITLTGVLVALLAQGSRIAAAVTSVPLGCRAAALRAKSWRAGFLPQSDPDAPGRARPRAPTGSPAVA